MAFLTLNGIDVSTMYGGEATPRLIGQGVRSISGNMLRDGRAVKREWRFTTPPISQAEASALIGMINGLGHHFTMDSDAVSDGGLTPASGYTGAVHHGANAADGDPQKIVYTAPATTGNLYALGSAIWCAEATANELTKDQSDADEDGAGTSGFAGYGAGGPTMATNATHYWQGARSIKVTVGDAGSGISTDTVNADSEARAVSGETFTFSVWVKGDSSGDATVTPKIQWRTVGDAQDSMTTGSDFTVTQNEWRRIWVTGTASANTTHYRCLVTSSTAGGVFYIDGLMAAETDTVTPWVVGASNYARIVPTYSTPPFSADAAGLTVAWWGNGSSYATGAIGDGMSFLLSVDANNYFQSYLEDTTEKPTLETCIAGTTTTSQYASAATFGAIVHTVCTLNTNTGLQSLYVNGTLRDSDTASGTVWSLADIANVYLGGTSTSANPLNGFLDQMIIMPYELTATQVSDLYNSGTPQSVGWPKMICTGDFVPDPSVTCFGRVTGVKYQGVTLSGTHTNNACSVEFSLMEV